MTVRITEVFELVENGGDEIAKYFVYQSEFYELEISISGTLGVRGSLQSLKGDYTPQIRVDRKTNAVTIQTTSHGSLTVEQTNEFVQAYQTALQHVPAIQALLAYYEAL